MLTNCDFASIFSDKKLLMVALTHRSASADNYERLEFLGDALLNSIITIALYERFGDLHEGDLSRLRASMVKEQTLADIANELQLGAHICLGLGERKSGGVKISMLADVLEALIGAMYLDCQDFVRVQRQVLAWFAPRLDNLSPTLLLKDAKTRLQEWLQARHIARPSYQVLQIIGQPPRQVFVVECKVPLLPPICIVERGESRKIAEQKAAELMISALANVTQSALKGAQKPVS